MKKMHGRQVGPGGLDVSYMNFDISRDELRSRIEIKNNY